MKHPRISSPCGSAVPSCVLEMTKLAVVAMCSLTAARASTTTKGRSFQFKFSVPAAQIPGCPRLIPLLMEGRVFSPGFVWNSERLSASFCSWSPWTLQKQQLEGVWRQVEVVGTSRACLDPMGSALVRGGAQGWETVTHQARGGRRRARSLAAQDNGAFQLATKGPAGLCNRRCLRK